MTDHAVLIAGAGPTGLMLAGELALAGVDVAIVERRPNQELVGLRAGGLHARTLEVLDQRGIAERFIREGKLHKAVHFYVQLDISDFPSRHNHVLALRQNHIERILADWVSELKVPIFRAREVTGFAQDDSGVEVELSDGQRVRAHYLVGCDGGRSVIRKRAGIEFAGWDATTSWLIAEVSVRDEPPWGFKHDAVGTHRHRLRLVGLGIGDDPERGEGPERRLPAVLIGRRVDDEAVSEPQPGYAWPFPVVELDEAAGGGAPGVVRRHDTQPGSFRLRGSGHLPTVRPYIRHLSS